MAAPPISTASAHASHLAQVFAQYPIEVAHGEGVWLYARDGRKILDFYGGHAVAGLGYGHPRWLAALERQARQMAFQTNALPMAIRERAAARLAKFAGLGLDTVFWVNSGAEANENALEAGLQDHRPHQGGGARTGLARPNRGGRRGDLGRAREVVRLSAHAVRRELHAARRSRPRSSASSIATRPRSSSSRCRAWAAPTMSANRCCRRCAGAATRSARC